MTAQVMEKLIFNGKEVYMASEPLACYLSNLKEKPHFFPFLSACWRGYIGTWEIKDDKLYLIGVESNGAILKNKQEPWRTGVDYIFPNQHEVFAEWFTGVVRIPQGDMLDYVHGGYESTFESDLFLEFKNGKLIGQRIVDNILEAAKDLINRKREIVLEKEITPAKEIIRKKKSIITRILYLLKKKK